MIKRGFTIIELMISMIIASILSVSLTNYLNQVYTFQTITTNIIDADMRASMVTAQLEADLMGIFAPYENLQEQEDDKPEEKNKDNKKTEEDKKAGRDITHSATAKDTEKKEDKIQPYENVFLAQIKNKQFNLLTMISTNALNVYWSETVGKPKPNVTRITYRLIADPINKESFMLTRREQKDLVYQPYKDEKQLSDEYVLADGIKECIITYHAQPSVSAPTTPEGFEGRSEASTRQTETKPITSQTWQWPKKKDTEDPSSPRLRRDKQEKEEITLPTMVTLELILWNEQYNRSTPFTYAIEIPFVYPLAISSSTENKKSDKKQGKDKAQDKKNNNQKQQTQKPKSK